MSYAKEIFERANLQQIAAFLISGDDYKMEPGKTYKQRIDEASDPMLEMLYEKFPDLQEFEKNTDKIYEYATAVESVSMEIGMQCGAMIITQLLLNNQRE